MCKASAGSRTTRRQAPLPAADMAPAPPPPPPPLPSQTLCPAPPPDPPGSGQGTWPPCPGSGHDATAPPLPRARRGTAASCADSDNARRAACRGWALAFPDVPARLNRARPSKSRGHRGGPCWHLQGAWAALGAWPPLAAGHGSFGQELPGARSFCSARSAHSGSLGGQPRGPAGEDGLAAVAFHSRESLRTHKGRCDSQAVMGRSQQLVLPVYTDMNLYCSSLRWKTPPGS